VTLRVENPVIESQKHVPFEVRFVNTGHGCDFYNLFFISRTLPPGQIALYDGNHKYIGDLMTWQSMSFRGESWDDWTFIPAGCSIQFTLNLRELPKTRFFRLSS
jgi:hypothetical protein